MESVDQTHREVVAVISDAVSELTRRAVRPELEPFKESLENNVGRWEGWVADLQTTVTNLRPQLNDLRRLAAELQQQTDGLTAQTGGLTAHVGELASRADDLRSDLTDLRQRQDGTAAALSRVEGAIRAHEAVVAAARARDQDLARMLEELRTVSHTNTELLTQSNATRAGLVTSLRTVRLVAVIGFTLLFVETIAWGVALLLHSH